MHPVKGVVVGKHKKHAVPKDCFNFKLLCKFAQTKPGEMIRKEGSLNGSESRGRIPVLD